MTDSVGLWRIAAETRNYPADDLSGAGAARSPGRWNDEGEFVVYTAQTLSLAVLETAAHIDDFGLPLNRYVVQIEVPVALWQARETLNARQLNPAWSAIPAGQASVTAGSAWYRARRSALLLVPSVLVPEEWAVLINARHPDAAQLRARTIRVFEFKRLFRR